MSRVVRFGVLPIFKSLGGKLKPLRVIDAASAAEAARKAGVYASVLGGAVAFSKAGDPELGTWDTAQIIARYGDVPDGVKS
jgi:hypothetical protein